MKKTLVLVAVLSSTGAIFARAEIIGNPSEGGDILIIGSERVQKLQGLANQQKRAVFSRNREQLATTSAQPFEQIPSQESVVKAEMDRIDRGQGLKKGSSFKFHQRAVNQYNKVESSELERIKKERGQSSEKEQVKNEEQKSEKNKDMIFGRLKRFFILEVLTVLAFVAGVLILMSL